MSTWQSAAGPPPIMPTSKSGADEFMSAAFSLKCLLEMRSHHRIQFVISQPSRGNYMLSQSTRRLKASRLSRKLRQVMLGRRDATFLTASCYLVNQNLHSKPRLKDFAHSLAFHTEST